MGGVQPFRTRAKYLPRLGCSTPPSHFPNGVYFSRELDSAFETTGTNDLKNQASSWLDNCQKKMPLGSDLKFTYFPRYSRLLLRQCPPHCFMNPLELSEVQRCARKYFCVALYCSSENPLQCAAHFYTSLHIMIVF